MMRSYAIVALAAAIGAAATARGLTREDDTWQSTSASAAERPARVEVFAGVGGGNFTQDLGDVTDAGVAWSGRVGILPTKFLGAELGYQGLNGSTPRVLTPAGAAPGQNVQQHEFSVAANAGYPVQVAGRTLRPYALAGVGYARFNSSDALRTAGLDDDNLFAVPLGAGVSYDVFGPFAVDGRFTYNLLSGVDQALVQSADSWTAVVNVGTRFGR